MKRTFWIIVLAGSLLAATQGITDTTQDSASCPEGCCGACPLPCAAATACTMEPVQP
jgi:hypothetical protein